jgi:S-adenosylmethionine synthetase
MAANDIVVSEVFEPPIASQRFELAECKGVGHPDALCDGMAERISFDYVQWCIANLGVVLHHNFDKLLLVAGESHVDFGVGTVTRPIRIKVGGRATHSSGGQDIPVASIVEGSAAAYLSETVRHLDPAEHCVIDSLVGQGNSQLVNLAVQGMANDTISCCAVWPRTPLEETVYASTRYLNQELISLLPIGEDVKVSAFRLDQQIQLIIAVPFLAREIRSIASYKDVKACATDYIRTFAGDIARCDVEVILNAADDLTSGHAYLTVTGTSAEMGDDGSVGRGNRASGLVAPLRPSSTPPAGKNPIGHPGKVYNVLAIKIAREVVDTIPEVEESRVLLLATIGQPLREPSLTHVAVRSTGGGLRRDIAAKVQSVTRSVLASTNEVLRDLLREYPRLF